MAAYHAGQDHNGATKIDLHTDLRHLWNPFKEDYVKRFLFQVLV
jgi:hypothetical protein